MALIRRSHVESPGCLMQTGSEGNVYMTSTRVGVSAGLLSTSVTERRRSGGPISGLNTAWLYYTKVSAKQEWMRRDRK